MSHLLQDSAPLSRGFLESAANLFLPTHPIGFTGTGVPVVILSLTVLLFVSGSAEADGGLRRWEWLGPGNAGGIVRSILIQPGTDPLRILAASPGGGIWLSTTAGATWQLTDGFLPSLVVNSLAHCDSNPNVIYAGTGESFANASPSPSFGRGAPGVGIFKSTNGGDSWSPLSSTASWSSNANRFVNYIAVHPTEPNLVLVATDAGIQRSTDGGLTWENPLPYDHRVTEVKWVNGFGFAVAGLENNAPSQPSASIDLPCVLFSRDFGQTWTNSLFVGSSASTLLASNAAKGDTLVYVLSKSGFSPGDSIRIGTGTTAEGARVANSSSPCAQAPNQICLSAGLGNAHSAGEMINARVCQRAALAVTPGGARIYASLGVGGGSIWRSDDGGMTFGFVSNPNPEDVGPADSARDFLLGRAFYNNVIWAAPLPPPNNSIDIVVVAGTEALRSTNSGVNFVRISDYTGFNEGNSAHSDKHAIMPDPRFPNVPTVYFGDDGGIQAAINIFTVEKNSGWVNLAHGLGLSQLWAGKATPDGQWIFGCGQDLGPVIRGPGDGVNDWFLWTDAADSRNGAVEANPQGSPFRFYNATSNLQVISNNVAGAGVTLVAPVEDVCSNDFSSVYRAVAIDPNNPAILIAAGKALWRNTNRAASGSWSIIRDALDCANNDVSLCNAIAIANNNSNLIWAGYNNGLLSRTAGSLSVWQDLNVPGQLPDCSGGVDVVNGAVSDILIDPNDSQRVFVTFVGKRYDFRLTCTQTVFVTTNGGMCWTPLMGSPPYILPATVATAIAMHPANRNWLYVATDKGVYASEDAGNTWSRKPVFPGQGHEGPYNVMVRDLVWHDPDYLVAATYGLGMHRARVPLVVHVDWTYAGTEELGTTSKPFNTVKEGVNLAGNGSNFSIRSGTYDETGTIQFDKRGYVRATGGAVIIR